MSISDSSNCYRKILFVLRNNLYVRNFEWPIRQLVDQGIQVQVLIGESSDTASGQDAEEQIAVLQADLGHMLSIEKFSGRRSYRHAFLSEVQSARDILFYTGEHYDSARFARKRIVRKSTPLAKLVFDRAIFRDPVRAEKTKALLAAFHDILPSSRSIKQKLLQLQPDLVVVSPLIDIRSQQLDWIKEARRLQFPTVLAVASWDNLTNKSSIQEMPDKVIVWNNVQKNEAIDLHKVPAENVIVTGAQLYDHWFEKQPSQSYEDFCAGFDFDPDEITLLYTGSSVSIAPNETPFVKSWLNTIRNCFSEKIRNANVLIRPHPLNQNKLSKVDFSEFGRVFVYPKSGGFPVTKRAQIEYFDALYHCAAVVGLNTSAIIESTILGKQSFTIQSKDYFETQQGTIHYNYLTKSGILHESSNFDQHIKALTNLLENPSDNSDSLERFVKEFLRPHGKDKLATPIFIRALQRTMSGTNPCQASNGSSSWPNFGLRVIAEILCIFTAIFDISGQIIRQISKIFARK